MMDGVRLRKERPSKPKIGRMDANLDANLFRGQKVKVTRAINAVTDNAP